MAGTSEGERRCANCGAVVYEGAEWCNLCFSSLDSASDTSSRSTPAPPGSAAASPIASPDTPVPPTGQRAPVPTASGPSTPVAVAAGVDQPATTPFWPCPVCEAKNPIELELCATCGTPFATLMREDRDRPHVEPSEAFRRSLLFPGLGHAALGLGTEGFARGVLFAILVLVTLLIAVAGVSSGLLTMLFGVYAAGAVGVYLLTAMEARRIAEGGAPIVSTRALLWGMVGVLMASIALITLVMGTAPRQ